VVVKRRVEVDHVELTEDEVLGDLRDIDVKVGVNLWV